VNRREVTFLLVAMILAAVFGGLVGDVVGSFLPERAAIKPLFVKHLVIGIGVGPDFYAVGDNNTPLEYSPVTIDFYAITLTFGFLIKINFVSVLFVLLVFVYFRWWFL
jgi:hypothetical protein